MHFIFNGDGDTDKLDIMDENEIDGVACINGNDDIERVHINGSDASDNNNNDDDVTVDVQGVDINGSDAADNDRNNDDDVNVDAIRDVQGLNVYF